ncbi:LptF/LptG family permease [Candidatus Pelagibacter sp.]|uniref:LptF/LptG family permease n=1 Tax=Candidatus Pelagibacter sp. TaxID=2024849 RepID=UPI003F833109
MSTYIKFIFSNYLKSFSYVFFIMLSLVIILNILTEAEFFKNLDVNTFLPFYLAILNSFDLIFEMFPFIFLISTQVFFVNLFDNNQINIFKYSGLKNSKIIMLLTFLTLFLGILIITLFYSFSSNLKNFYLEYKNQYASDNKYLAVVTKNGLWIRDNVNKKKMLINADKINSNFLENVNISEFDNNNQLTQIITSEKVDISSNHWKLYDAKLVKDNLNEYVDVAIIYSNFNYEKINSLFSNLSALSMLELFDLRKNYKQINYSLTEIDLQLQKIISYPIYYALMMVLSTIIMFNTKFFKSTSLKITIGLFFCVVIYYINNLFQALGSTDKIPLTLSVWFTLLILFGINSVAILKINEK